MTANDNVQYKEIIHKWTDIWDNSEVTASYRFARPNASHIKRMQSGAAKNPANAAYQLLLDTVHADDKDRLVADLEKYPALITTISGVIIKACGVADLGN